jgi:hypothetical protein
MLAVGIRYNEVCFFAAQLDAFGTLRWYEVWRPEHIEPKPKYPMYDSNSDFDTVVTDYAERIGAILIPSWYATHPVSSQEQPSDLELLAASQYVRVTT